MCSRLNLKQDEPRCIVIFVAEWFLVYIKGSVASQTGHYRQFPKPTRVCAKLCSFNKIITLGRPECTAKHYFFYRFS